MCGRDAYGKYRCDTCEAKHAASKHTHWLWHGDDMADAAKAKRDVFTREYRRMMLGQRAISPLNAWLLAERHA